MFDTVKAVLFDAVGTLMRPDPAVADVYHLLGRRFGSKLSVDEIEQRFYLAVARYDNGGAGPQEHETSHEASIVSGAGELSYERPPTSESLEKRRWQRIVAEVFQDVPNARGPLFQSLWDHFASGQHWRLYDDAPFVWEQLRDRGLVVGVASNFDGRLRQICSQIAVLSGCRHVFWSSDVGFSKPSPRFFRTIQRRIGLVPHELMLIGDHPVNDFRGARSAGWHAVLLDRIARFQRQTEPTPAGHVIHDLNQLPPLLSMMNS